ncbi:MAG: protein phosphatase 2C domain-containing protein [Anaerolineae bacterium]
MITCLKCGAQNRREAKFCSSCGADLSPPGATPPGQSDAGTETGLAQKIKRWVTGGGPSSPPPPAGQSLARTRPLQTKPLEPPQTITRLAPLQRGSLLSHPQNHQHRYSIVTARELPRSTYYDALDLACPTCRSSQPNVPHDGLCQQCHAPLLPVLIHERRSHPDKHLSEANIERLIRLSAGHANILAHQAIIQYRESIYTVVEHPGRWGVLVRGRQQRSPDEALAGTAQIGQALSYLYDHGFAHCEVGGASIESLIIVGGERSLKLADLSVCTPLQPQDTQALRAQVNSDSAFLAWLLFYLATGKELSRTSIEFVPPPLRPLVERAMRGEYPSVQDMLVDFTLLPSIPPSARSLKPSHGQATHPGKKHTRNEDAVVTFTFDKEQDGRAVPIGFYLVADGMGGHDAGDLASRTVNQIVTDWIIKTKVLPDLRKTTRKLTTEDVPGELLAQAIQQANAALLRHARTKGSDLGSTVTAALIIGNVATIANVGDSRTYLLREGRLEQITQDHSLVARLVDAGVIGPEEVRTHPQRNRIYRCLGHEPDVEVNTFTRQLRAGDVLVLCSDGLWEMVPDTEIQRIIERARSPQKACDELIEAANRAGGEDNIGVVVVEME